MSEFNKSYRIRTEVGKDKSIHVKLDRNYDILEIMSLKINQENAYKFHTSNYGVVTGRVIANGGFGVPNAKISVFINIDDEDINDVVKSVLYPYNTTLTTDNDNVRYNLLPDEQVSNCHTIIGTFPEKQYMLDNDNILEIFEKYYKFTTRTNNSGDYMIFGVPTGMQTIHMDVDLSDIGFLSQKPRDMIYKGYHISQFENPNKFKYDTNLNNLTQVISQDITTEVIPFWGESGNGSIGITRCDINVQYKFEPTCVFMGSVVTDSKSNGISRKCIPMPNMGAMDEITTGSGTIEMIRKTPDGNVEEFQIMGTQLIDGDGVWCYQIPMNLDYMMTDEYGNMVPTNDPNKGIPTRTKVRFRISMQEFENNTTNMYQCKMLVPHNPNIYSNNCDDELDYQFGSSTKEDSFKDLFWNGVYSVKSYIPRIQKGTKWRSEKFTGFKRVNYYNDKNPIPYNNIRIKLSFIFTIICYLFKMYIRFVGFTNKIYKIIGGRLAKGDDEEGKTTASFISFSGEMCNEDLDYLCIIPGIDIKRIANGSRPKIKGLLAMAIVYHYEDMGKSLSNTEIGGFVDGDKSIKDGKSIDNNNKEQNDANYHYGCAGYDHCISGIRVTDKTDYLIQCMEIKLAEEYRVIQFDFYNDWLNGLIYIPRWVRTVKKKRRFFRNGGETMIKIKACNENFSSRNRNIVQQCALKYNFNNEVTNNIGCDDKKLKCHKSSSVRKGVKIFKQGGILKTILTSRKQNVYYFKPYEDIGNGKNVRLFATDIILLGTLNDCDKWGIPNDLTELTSSTYQLPPNLALVDSHSDTQEYGTNIDTNKKIKISFGKSKGKDSKSIKASINIDECYTGVDIIESDGSYTEMSGIDWAYNGPLQNNLNDVNNLFKPGGHFLGISCRNAETTIKSCVNLSRICELGVWMSQRQDINVLNNDGNFSDYATVPTGFISKDDISDSNYRSAFASMNQNQLKTKIDPETLYPIYDFEFVAPNNFNGDLNNYIHSDNLGSPYNKYITNQVYEREYDYYNDENDFDREEIENEIINETQIMRTAEYKDNEYYKFRFGDTLDVSKNYMINEKDGNLMPLYNNSYYFYFGLHEGKTALDKFKQEYYAVCEANNDLVQTSDSIMLKDIKIESDGLCPNNGTGFISFKVKTDLENSKPIIITVKDETGEKVDQDNIIINDELNEFKIENLTTGNYNINVNINGVEKDFNIDVPAISFNAELNDVGFIQEIKDNTIEETFTHERLNENGIGGYITIKNNKVKYISNTYEDNIILNPYDVVIKYNLKDITITQHTITCDENGKWKLDDEFCYTHEEKNDNNEFVIPVPLEDIDYSVYVKIALDKNCKLDKSKRGEYLYYLGSVRVKSAQKMLLYYNDLLYDDYFKRLENTEYKEWWKYFEPSSDDVLEEDGLDFDEYAIWKIKESLYQTSVGEDITHKVNILSTGGIAPIETIIEGVVKNNGTENITPITDEKEKDLGNIKTPTLNYKDAYWDYYTYKSKDNNGQIYPKEKFKFPVVYKPFFMELGLWYFENNNKSYLSGNVYNGKTYDYKNHGFNSVSLNNVSIANIDITHPDNWMEINEPNRDSLKNEKGGWNYKGDYCKYNGRKTTVNREIEPSNYGIYADSSNKFRLEIGCKHEKNGVVVKDNTTYFNDNLRLFNFEFEGKTYEGGYYVYMNLNNNDGNYNLYVIDNKTYPYPTNMNELNSSKLFADIMDNNVKQYDAMYYTFNGRRDWIKISDLTHEGIDIYYIAVNKEDIIDNINITTSNALNKIKFISISNLIKSNELNKFYPLNITVTIEDYEFDANKANLKVIPNADSVNNFKNKKIEIFIYKRNKNENIQLLRLEKYTGENSNFTIDISQNFSDLELNNTNLPDLYCSYYVYSGEIKSPTIYNIEDKIKINVKEENPQ